MALDRAGSTGRQYRALQTGRLFSRAAGICAALVIAASQTTTAQALSCAPHTLAGTLERIVNAPDGYVAFTGTLTFDEDHLPKTDWDNQEQTPYLTRIPAKLTGHSLTAEGFTHPIDNRITLDVRCAGPWCASPPSGKTVLAFVKQSAGKPTLTIGPCGGDIFFDPPQTALDTAKACYLENKCPKPEF